MSLPNLFDTESEDFHPFDGVNVYFSGEFLHSEETLKKKIEELGFLKVKEIEHAGVIVLGNNQPKSDVATRIKRQLWDGYVIPTITEEQLFSFHYSSPYKEYFNDLFRAKEREKLSITYEHFTNPIYSPIAHFTDDEDAPTLEGKEVFMLNGDDKDDLRDDPVKRFLEDKMGAKVRAYFDPQKTDYCLLRASTLKKLEEKQKDTFIKMIENGYNQSSCSEFRPKFILEREVLAFMKKRGEK